MFHDTYATIAIEQYQAALNYPEDIYLTGPKYQYTYHNGVHMIAASYRAMGALDGKVMKAVLVDGQADWLPLSPIAVTTTGTTITARFHVPVPPLVVDTTT